MKTDDIIRAVGQLDEELIRPVQEERRNPNMKKKHSRTLWYTVSACAASLALIAGILTVSAVRNDTDNNQSHETTDSTLANNGSDRDTSPGSLFRPEQVYAAALAAAEYPDMAQYPDEMSCIRADGSYDDEKWESMYTPWQEQRNARLTAGRASSSPDRFYETTTRQFLSDAGNENRVYSPLNVYLALAMLAETTDSNSRAQLLGLLGAENIEALRTQTQNLWTANYRNDGATTSILANSLWLNENISFTQETLDTLAQNYYASSFSGDPASGEMTELLRAWLNDQTGGLLKDAIDQVELQPETILTLCSTVYFRAKWDNCFNPKLNDQKIFHSANGDTNTEFMNATSTYGPYYWSDDYSAISLPFVDGGSMWLILPDEDKTVDDVLAGGDYLNMCERPGDWTNQKGIIVHYSVPKFDVSSKLDLTDGLKALGITDIFDFEHSDFDPLMTDANSEIAVTEAQHAARVMIDEDGCTAAAFTEMMMAGGAMPPEDEIDFVLDRPFLFVIVSDTGSPLFTGVVNQP